MSNKQAWRPNLVGVLPPQAVHAIGLLYDAIGDHDNAINTLHGQVQKASATSSATTSTATVTTTGTATVIASTGGRIATSPTGQFSSNSSGTAATASSYAIGAFISGINNQGAATSYSVQDSDYNGLIVFSTAFAVSVTLNSAVQTNFTCIVQNIGPSQITLTPSTGTVNGAGSMVLQVGASTGTFFDGVNWWALTSPQAIVPHDTPAVAHEWINSYNAATGVFTQTQPAFLDISGVATPVQLPTATSLALGIVKPDNTTITISAGVITSVGGGGTAFTTSPLVLAVPNGGTTYTIPITVTVPAASFYFVNGIKRIYGTYYSISGTTLTILDPDLPDAATGDTHELYAS